MLAYYYSFIYYDIIPRHMKDNFPMMVEEVQYAQYWVLSLKYPPWDTISILSTFNMVNSQLQ